MINISESIIRKLYTQQVRRDSLHIEICEDVQTSSEQDLILKNIFLKPFSSCIETYEFHHDIDINLNPLYKISNDIYNEGLIKKYSNDILKHLISVSKHPNIKEGDLFIIKYDDICFENTYYEALGIYKIENKDNFIEPIHHDNETQLKFSKGINGRKIDKACLILFTEKPYTIFIIENNNRDTDYWQNEFINLSSKNDDTGKTINYINITKEFVKNTLPKEFSTSKAEQADLLNKSIKYFKENDTFISNDFENEVISNDKMIESFNNLKYHYQNDKKIELSDNFTISESAVKKQVRILKSVIKLDKNFHIYVHGNNQLIKKGYDEETGLYFYQLFFKEEL